MLSETELVCIRTQNSDDYRDWSSNEEKWEKFNDYFFSRMPCKEIKGFTAKEGEDIDGGYCIWEFEVYKLFMDEFKSTCKTCGLEVL